MSIQLEVLTTQQGIEIQRSHLDGWKAILKPEVYADIKKQINEINYISNYANGYDVFRGDDIATLVANHPAKRAAEFPDFSAAKKAMEEET